MKKLIALFIICIIPIIAISQNQKTAEPAKTSKEGTAKTTKQAEPAKQTTAQKPADASKTTNATKPAETKQATDQNSASSQKTRIGVFDSRVIALAFYQGPEGEKEGKALIESFEKAKKENDTAAMIRIQEVFPLYAKVANDQGLGRGSVALILERYNKELTELAKKNNLSYIVSQWELFVFNRENKNIEFVNVTAALLEMFKPNETVINNIKEVIKNKPINNAIYLNIQPKTKENTDKK